MTCVTCPEAGGLCGGGGSSGQLNAEARAVFLSALVEMGASYTLSLI